MNLSSVERDEISVIVGGAGESCEVSEGGHACEDRAGPEDDVNQVCNIWSLSIIIDYVYTLK